ncbi:MAG: YraN family protein [Leptospiraceae bacterium]|nr:YraN family protein [Leptospiraceae bacterium]
MKGRLDFQFRHPAEGLAWQYLAERGHRLIRHNYHCRFCEFDLITFAPDQSIQFSEVKAWQSSSLVHPLEGIQAQARRNWHRGAHLFLSEAQAQSAWPREADLAALPLDWGDCTVRFALLWVQNRAHPNGPAITYFDNLEI